MENFITGPLSHRNDFIVKQDHESMTSLECDNLQKYNLEESGMNTLVLTCNEVTHGFMCPYTEFTF